jgi:hypothetical protein
MSRTGVRASWGAPAAPQAAAPPPEAEPTAAPVFQRPLFTQRGAPAEPVVFSSTGLGSVRSPAAVARRTRGRRDARPATASPPPAAPPPPAAAPATPAPPPPAPPPPPPPAPAPVFIFASPGTDRTPRRRGAAPRAAASPPGRAAVRSPGIGALPTDFFGLKLEEVAGSGAAARGVRVGKGGKAARSGGDEPRGIPAVPPATRREPAAPPPPPAVIFSSGAAGQVATRTPRRRAVAAPTGRSPVRAPPAAFAGHSPARAPPVVPLAASPAAPPAAPTADAWQAQQQQAAEARRLERAEAQAAELRAAGNEAFKRGDYARAHAAYTRAIVAAQARAPGARGDLALLLSNRAAAALALGRPLRALEDCRAGAAVDPAFAKCVLRAATCHVRMGAFAAARAALGGLRGAAAAAPALAREAGDKAAEVAWLEAGARAALAALGHAPPPGAAPPPPSKATLAEALAELEELARHVPHAEALHAARAEALLRLGRLADAAAACTAPEHADADVAAGPAPWRVWLMAQASFHSGDAQRALVLLGDLKRHPALPSGGTGVADGSPAAIARLPDAAAIDVAAAALAAAEELRQRGNAAVKARDYEAAVAAYAAALAPAGLSPALAAVLHCNRAAAHHGAGRRALALADCARAKALLPGYSKAHSRAAAVFAELRMHGAAAEELSAALADRALAADARREYQRRLADARARAAAGAAPRAAAATPKADHYQLLGVARGCSVDEAQRAYKRLALALHPDKAAATARFAARLGAAGSELAAPAAGARARLAEAATLLFKHLGEARDVLADAVRRRELDAQLDGHGGGHAHGHGGYHYGARPHAGFGAGAYYSDPYHARSGASAYWSWR